MLIELDFYLNVRHFLVTGWQDYLDVLLGNDSYLHFAFELLFVEFCNFLEEESRNIIKDKILLIMEHWRLTLSLLQNQILELLTSLIFS